MIFLSECLLCRILLIQSGAKKTPVWLVWWFSNVQYVLSNFVSPPWKNWQPYCHTPEKRWAKFPKRRKEQGLRGHKKREHIGPFFIFQTLILKNCIVQNKLNLVLSLELKSVVNKPASIVFSALCLTWKKYSKIISLVFYNKVRLYENYFGSIVSKWD